MIATVSISGYPLHPLQTSYLIQTQIHWLHKKKPDMTSAESRRKSVLITGWDTNEKCTGCNEWGTHTHILTRISCSPGGIGNSLAREFNRNGLRVFATARDNKSIQDLEAIGIETFSLVVDSEESVKDCFDEISKRLDGKGMDYLVNNAWVFL